MHSEFFLDDAGNLQALSKITEFDLNQIALFSLSGNSGPSGRPLSLITFALQFTDWPSNPYAFKFVNLMIHLINTILVFIFSRQLFQLRPETQKKCYELALLVATIWAIHPIQVTTVLYCIQRMTELSSTFVLFGIILYLHGRKRLTDSSKGFSTYFWMSSGLILGTILSILCKENGILILLFILVTEKTILSTSPHPHKHFKTWQYCFIYIPIIIVSSYFFYKFNLASFQPKPYTFEERLITENAVVFDYLRKIIFPSFNSFSLYHDNFPISKNLFDSFQTLAGFLFITSSTIFSLIYRKQFPLISFGFLWYYAGLILESSFIPIELYFEHRNYLPLFGISFGIIGIFYKTAHPHKSNSSKLILYSCLFLFISYLSLLTYKEATLWGKRYQAKLTWALERPESARAQSSAANVMAYLGNYKQALLFTKKIIQLTPNDPSPYIAWLQYRCYTDSIPHPDLELLYSLAKHGNIENSTTVILNTIILDMEDGKCQNISYKEVKQLFINLEQNKNLPRPADFHQIYALFEGGHKNYIEALNQGEKSLFHFANIKVMLFQLRWLSLLNNYQAAYKYLHKVREINNSHPKTSILYLPIIEEWEDYILEHIPSSHLQKNN